MPQIVSVHTDLIGEIKTWAADTAPQNHLICDGTAVSRITYAALFARIGITHGQGDNSTTFNLPDYRGRILRGVDGSAGNDPDKTSRTAMNIGGNTGNSVGSVQVDETKSHAHGYIGALSRSQQNAVDDGYSHTYAGWQGTNSGYSTNASGGNETRPKNAYVNYIIKAL